MIADAKARGHDVDCDAYPYAAGSNPLKNLLPQWVQSGGVPAMLERLTAARHARENPRRHRARRPQQLGPHPVVGLRADLDLAAPAAIRRPHHRAARRRARQGSDPIDTLCDYLADDQGATRVLVTSISEDDIERHRRLADGARRLRRQLRRALRHGRQGHAASALLRHLPAHHRPLRARARRAAARACDPQDDRRDRARAQAQGPRAA